MTPLADHATGRSRGIAHLYKSQVYELARHLILPDAVVKATPTTDTYSMEQTQDEFFFSLPFGKMDLAL